MEWNYLSIPKLQRCNRWSFVMDKSFHRTLYWPCNNVFMQILILTHVSKISPWSFRSIVLNHWYKKPWRAVVSLADCSFPSGLTVEYMDSRKTNGWHNSRNTRVWVLVSEILAGHLPTHLKQKQNDVTTWTYHWPLVWEIYRLPVVPSEGVSKAEETLIASLLSLDFEQTDGFPVRVNLRFTYDIIESLYVLRFVMQYFLKYRLRRLDTHVTSLW